MPRTGANAKGSQFVRFFGPLLDALRELGGSGRPSEVEAAIAARLNLLEEELNRVTKSGQSRFSNQVAWARFYLVKAGLVESSGRGVWSLTEQGQNTRLSHREALDLFRQVHLLFPRASDAPQVQGDDAPEEAGTVEPPTPALGYREVLLATLKSLPPSGFERICQRLLRESDFQQVTVTGRTGDGGIDGHGVVQVNPFVSFRVLFQCKRYDTSQVTASQVRDFRGAMAGRADKGIIITTGAFTADAKREAVRDGVPPIELVDGETLVSLFERLQLGLKPVHTYEIDPAFFEEFR
jgi:restriction system protein